MRFLCEFRQILATENTGNIMQKFHLKALFLSMIIPIYLIHE